MFKRFFLVLLAGTLLGGMPVMAATLENETAGAIVRDAARQNSLGECVITSGTSDCTRCKKIAKAGHVPAFFMSSH